MPFLIPLRCPAMLTLQSVMVPRKVALTVERSHKQELAAEKYIESLKEA